MQWLHPERDAGGEYSLKDIFITPNHFDPGDPEKETRRAVDLRPWDFTRSSHPLVVTNMRGVTGRRMLEVAARKGGLAILDQDTPVEVAIRKIALVKAADPWCDTALIIRPDEQIREVGYIINKRAARMVVVVDEHNHPIGVLTTSDIERAGNLDDGVRTVIQRSLVTIEHGTPDEAAFTMLFDAGVNAAPVVNSDGVLVGTITRDDLIDRRLNMLPSLDSDGRLMVAAAVGINGGADEAAVKLVAAGVNVILVDTAHGDQVAMLRTIRAVRAALPDHIPVVAGTVATAEAADRLFSAGADGLKVNIGGGGACTTRPKTGVGRPTFTSTLECAKVAAAAGKFVWADGGVREPEDGAKYLAAGASRVLVGTIFAGTWESPGDVQYDGDGKPFKANFGMASRRAVTNRNKGMVSPYEAAIRDRFREGISAGRVYLRPDLESVGLLTSHFVTGLRSSCTYGGALTIREFQERVVVGVQTASGYAEGPAQGVVK